MREIASGGFGSVFLAKVIHADGFSRFAAVKLLHPKWSENDEIASRMRDEARLLGQLRHRNIVEVLDLTMIDGRVAVIMEYLEAVDLRTIIEHCRRVRLHMPLRVALEISACVASALDAAYNRPPMAGEKPLRVIHRDIKPSNVMIDDSGTPKVLDFGVARADFKERESQTQEIAFGSVDYMPPERMFFEPEAASSDIYSLGCTLYELVALEKFGKGKLRPEQHERLIRDRVAELVQERPDIRDDEREELSALLLDMLAFDEADRPSAEASAEKMRTLARRIRDEDTVTEWSERTVPPLVEENQRKQSRGPRNPLVDMVVEEDSRGFKRGREREPGRRDDDDVGLDHAPPEDDARWNALKRATLAEIEGSTGGTPRPVPSRPASPSSLMGSMPPPPPRVRSSVGARPGEIVDIGTVPPPRARTRDPDRSAADPGGRIAPSAEAAAAAGFEPELGEDDPTEEAWDDDDDDERGGIGMIGAAVAISAGLVVFLVVAVLALVAAIGIVHYGMAEGSVAVGAPEPVPEVGPAPTPAPKAAPKAAPEVAVAPVPPKPPKPAVVVAEAGAVPTTVTPAPKGAPGELRVVSALSATKKLTVRCDGGSSEGTTEVTVAGAPLGECTITAIDASRKRLVAVVKDAAPGTLTCFEGGEKVCK